MILLDKNPQNISEMFNQIAFKYDLINNITTFGIVNFWRKSLVKAINPKPFQNVLDVATGTGKLAYKIASTGANVTGIDISQKMLEKAKSNYKNIDFLKADVTNLPFDDNSFEIVTISFGIRNVNNIEKALKEMYRVTKNNGYIYICEFSMPTNKIVEKIYKIYMTIVFEKIMKLTKNIQAYKYLNESIKNWCTCKELSQIMLKTNWENPCYKKLNFGIVTLYKAKKNSV